MAARRHLALLLLAAACARPPVGGSPPPAPGGVAPAIDTIGLRADTWFLAHDRLRGRDTGSSGAELAGQYIASRCLALGLEVHELPVPLVESHAVASGTAVTVAGQAFEPGRDFILTSGTARALRGFDAVPVWVGGTDDLVDTLGLPPLEGRVALTAGPVRPDAAAALTALGAVGMIHLLSEPAMFDVHRLRRGAAMLHLADPEVRSSFHPDLPAIIAHPDLSRALAIAAREGRRVVHTVRTRTDRVPGVNIACALPGHDHARRDRWIGYTAHYDHLGVGPPDAQGDSIYNGFSDNAVGVAMLLGIADAMRSTTERSLRHSVVFLFFTGEERGLLGSDYYVHAPLVPLDRMAAVINLDAGAPPARVWSWRIAGGDDHWLGEVARKVAARRGWAATTSPATPNSDYFPFARMGVPAVFLIPGPAPYEGLSADSSQALRQRWDRYHHPADEWHADFPFAGLERYAEYALLLGLAVDGAEDGRRTAGDGRRSR